MTSNRSTRMSTSSLVLAMSAFAVCAPLLAGCGGGELLAPDATAMQTDREQAAALTRATALNKIALSARVKGERATGAPAP
jgi:hypothetical protein